MHGREPRRRVVAERVGEGDGNVGYALGMTGIAALGKVKGAAHRDQQLTEGMLLSPAYRDTFGPALG